MLYRQTVLQAKCYSGECVLGECVLGEWVQGESSTPYWIVRKTIVCLVIMVD